MSNCNFIFTFIFKKLYLIAINNNFNLNLKNILAYKYFIKSD